MKALHRGLEVSKALERLETEVLKHDIARLQSKSLLQTALDHIAQRDRELEAQILQVDRDLYALTDERQELTRQRRWLAEQRQQLVDEAAAEGKG